MAFKWGCVTVLIALVAPAAVSKYVPRCVVCSKENPLEADRCSRCHAPLLK